MYNIMQMFAIPSDGFPSKKHFSMKKKEALWEEKSVVNFPLYV